MQLLTEAEFRRICEGIRADRESIVKHNPVGTPRETLLWMLLSVMISYLSLDDNEIPCFTGRPDENMFREAIMFIVNKKRAEVFDADVHLKALLTE